MGLLYGPPFGVSTPGFVHEGLGINLFPQLSGTVLISLQFMRWHADQVLVLHGQREERCVLLRPGLQHR